MFFGVCCIIEKLIIKVDNYLIIICNNNIFLFLKKN